MTGPARGRGMFHSKLNIQSILPRHAVTAAAIIAHASVLLSLPASALKSEEPFDERSRPHEIGMSAGIFNNSFVDDVISSVVYTASSPVYGVFYRLVADEARGFISLRYGSYTAQMRDGFSGDDFLMFDSDGDTYTYPRSMHEMDGSRGELTAGVLVRVTGSQDGKTAFYLGGNMQIFMESMKSYDYWSKTKGIWRQKSELSGYSIIMTGKLERRIRRFDRLSLDLDLTIAALVERMPYYSPLARLEDLDEDSNVSPNTYGMLFYDYLNWSAQVSYMFWMGEKFGLEACYVFRHQRVNEPRDLRYVSHTFSLGIIYAIKSKE